MAPVECMLSMAVRTSFEIANGFDSGTSEFNTVLAEGVESCHRFAPLQVDFNDYSDNFSTDQIGVAYCGELQEHQFLYQ